jgi:hypothetical protein
VRTKVDPRTPKDFLGVLVEEAERAEDVFLFYYVGHGLVGVDNELYLATRSTEDEDVGLGVDALAYATVRDVLTTKCRARSIAVVLDCCYSGRAANAFGTAVADALDLTYVRNSFLLSSASATERALAPEDKQFTAFSHAVIRLLREGDPTAPRNITFEHVYRHLARVLPATGVPRPHRRAGDHGGDLVLADNPAAPPVTMRRIPRSPRTEEPLDEPECPYRGLDAFGTEDADYFFGRDRLVARILARLADGTGDAGPVAIVGRSGVGKSSVARAGVLSAIRSGKLVAPGSRDWPHLIITPGEHPLRTLADRLAHSAGTPADTMAERLLADPTELTGYVRTALRQRGATRLVLLVDQFEELFTTCGDERERRAFLDAVFSASSAADRTTTPPLLTMLGIRADFYGHCTAYPRLAGVLGDAQVVVEPMDGEALREVIERPAEVAGLVLEDGLVDRLLQDLHAGRGDAEEVAAHCRCCPMRCWRRGSTGRTATRSH